MRSGRRVGKTARNRSAERSAEAADVEVLPEVREERTCDSRTAARRLLAERTGNGFMEICRPILDGAPCRSLAVSQGRYGGLAA
jgi:hypothetical protein